MVNQTKGGADERASVVVAPGPRVTLECLGFVRPSVRNLDSAPLPTLSPPSLMLNIVLATYQFMFEHRDQALHFPSSHSCPALQVSLSPSLAEHHPKTPVYQTFHSSARVEFGFYQYDRETTASSSGALGCGARRGIQTEGPGAKG